MALMKQAEFWPRREQKDGHAVEEARLACV